MSESELVNDSFRKFPPISSRLSVDEGTVQRGRMMPKSHNGCTSGPVATKNIRVERKKKRKTVAVNGIPVAGHALTADGTVLDPSAPTELSEEAMTDLEMLASGETDVEELAEYGDEHSQALLDDLGSQNVF